MAHEESVQTHAYTYTVLLEPDEDGGFVVTCPALPGLVTHGETLEQAREHAAEAIELYLECLQAEGSSIPAGEERPAATRREPITVKLSYSV
jgi:predicted RNase H-like HicB family nuclease